MSIKLINPVSVKVIPSIEMYTNTTNPEDHCTHKVNLFRGNSQVDSLPFVYEGNDIVKYALDLLKQHGKIADRIEISES